MSEHGSASPQVEPARFVKVITPHPDGLTYGEPETGPVYDIRSGPVVSPTEAEMIEAVGIVTTTDYLRDDQVEDLACELAANRDVSNALHRFLSAISNPFFCNGAGDVYAMARYLVSAVEPAPEPEPVLESPTGSRTPIKRRTRTIVFERDEYRCVECGGYKDLSIDHIHPVSKGGSNDLENLQTLCRSCNSRKGART